MEGKRKVQWIGARVMRTLEGKVARGGRAVAEGAQDEGSWHELGGAGVGKEERWGGGKVEVIRRLKTCPFGTRIHNHSQSEINEVAIY